MTQQPTAALVIIGNEILSGRTQDKNLNYIAKNLAEIGVIFTEVRVVRDIESAIIKAVNELRTQVDYVFTTGGIGPTHDDITSECIAKALGLKYVMNAEAEAILRNHYSPEEINEARLRMARMPEGAELIPNLLTSAPGYRVENVYVMAGLPSIMQSMFNHVKTGLRHGKAVLSRAIATNLREGVFAEELGLLQNELSDIEIGSYPHYGEEFCVTIIARGVNEAELILASEKITNLLQNLGGKTKV